MDFKKDFTVTNTSDSEVTITGEIPFETLKEQRSKAITALGSNIEVAGFRKGHVPENIVVEKIGEINILTEMAERALAHTYPKIIEAHEIAPIGHPKIEITKIAPDNPLGFKATVAVMPEITLPEYKEIAATANKDKAEAEVTPEEIEKQIEDIMRQKIAYERMQSKAEQTSTEEDGNESNDPVTELPTPESEKAKETEDNLPELTDEYVQSLGQPDQFSTVADFKEKIKEHLSIQKKQEVEANHRAKITDAIIAKSEFTVPEILIESELTQMFAQMNEDIQRANLKMEDYLTHIKKTKEELQKEWRPAAEKRAKLQLVLNEIAEKENITPDEEAVQKQVAQLKEQYKDADEARVKVYVASVLQNEAVMKMLEAQ